MQYTKSELIKIIQEKAKELGRIPTRREISQQTPIRKTFGSWNNALTAAGYEKVNQRTLSAAKISELFHEWIRINKRVPTTSDLILDQNLPDNKTIQRHFKMSYPDFIKSLGYEPIDVTVYLQSDEELLQLLKNEIQRLGTTKKEVFLRDRNKTLVPSLAYYENRFKKRWNHILVLAGIPKDSLTNFQHTSDDIIKILQRVYKESGEIPSKNKMEQWRYSSQCIRTHFKNYNNALIAAGITPKNKTPDRVKETDEELIQMYIDFSNRLGAAATGPQLNASDDIYNVDVFTLRFGGLDNLRKRAGFVSSYRPKKYSQRELTEKLKRIYKENGGRIPIRRLKEFGLCATTLMRYFQTTKMSKIWEEIEKEIVNDN
ncbi:hypothetical protein COO03_04950 [Bacillus sp. AFS098217]|nr:hypothetical protein COO03_04950 [Bacillus sp. AFS098217]